MNNIVEDMLTRSHEKPSSYKKCPKKFTPKTHQDCFNKNKQDAPKFTAWSGTAVDFIWLNKHWNLPIAGSYVHYSPASDHLPIITDVKIS